MNLTKKILSTSLLILLGGNGFNAIASNINNTPSPEAIAEEVINGATSQQTSGSQAPGAASNELNKDQKKAVKKAAVDACAAAARTAAQNKVNMLLSLQATAAQIGKSGKTIFSTSNNCGGKPAIFRVADKNLTLHVLGGNKEAKPLALHGNKQYAQTKKNSQFKIIPVGNGNVILKTIGTDLTLHAWGGSKKGAEIKLHNGVGYAKKHANSQFEIIETKPGSGLYIIKVSNADLTLHAFGGSKQGARIKLHGGTSYAKSKPNSQFAISCLN